MNQAIEETKKNLGVLPRTPGLRAALEIGNEHNFFQVYEALFNSPNAQSVRDYIALHQKGDILDLQNRTLHIVPIGMDSIEDQELCEFFVQFLQHYLQTKRLETLNLPVFQSARLRMLKSSKNQLKSDAVVDMISRNTPRTSAGLVGISFTPFDGQKSWEDRPIRLLDMSRNFTTFQQLQYLCHETLHLLKIEHCSALACVMNSCADMEKLYLEPVCLRKLSIVRSTFDVIDRYEKLIQLITEASKADEKLMEYCRWCCERLVVLGGRNFLQENQNQNEIEDKKQMQVHSSPVDPSKLQLLKLRISRTRQQKQRRTKAKDSLHPV